MSMMPRGGTRASGLIDQKMKLTLRVTDGDERLFRYQAALPPLVWREQVLMIDSGKYLAEGGSPARQSRRFRGMSSPY